MMATLRALAEPHRLHIVELLRDGPRPVGDMVQRLRLRQPQVSKHLRVLSAAGLVDVRVDAQRSEEHTSELQSHLNLVCRLLLEKKKKNQLHLERAHPRRVPRTARRVT